MKFQLVPFFYLSLLLFFVSCDVSSKTKGKETIRNKQDTAEVMKLSNDSLMTTVQEATFQYFWDFAHPESGLAPERTTTPEIVTIGGSGFGVMAVLVGIERNFISREQGLDRLLKIVRFLEKADRFHGVWPHWMYGDSGKVRAFSQKDDGGDLVETSFMIQGLLTVREYFNGDSPKEQELRESITRLWEQVEWDWYTKGGEEVLYWHWSPNYGWEMNHQIRGYNEALITYLLAAASPTHSVPDEVYHNGWAQSTHFKNGKTYYGYELPLGFEYGGPLFFAHYSFLGLDPRGLKDRYADYWQQNVKHTLINRAYCIENPKDFEGYSDQSWGLTASDNPFGYLAHAPGDTDNGTITPTAALSSIPYAPEHSLEAMRYFYEVKHDSLWGEYGFLDAYNPTENWYADQYLAIDQGPIVIMIENYRTGLLWDLFMQVPEVQAGLKKLGFISPAIE